MSRQGLHKPGKARLQFFIEPRTKILLALVGQEFDFDNMTDALNGLVEMAAKAKGIISDDGRINPSFANRYKAEEVLIIKTK